MHAEPLGLRGAQVGNLCYRHTHTHTHTHTECSTYFFPTTTMVTRTPHNVTLHVLCMSCHKETECFLRGTTKSLNVLHLNFVLQCPAVAQAVNRLRLTIEPRVRSRFVTFRLKQTRGPDATRPNGLPETIQMEDMSVAEQQRISWQY